MDELRAMKILGITFLDATKLEEAKDLPMDKLGVKELCQIALCSRFIKLVHAATLLYVNQPKGHGEGKNGVA